VNAQAVRVEEFRSAPQEFKATILKLSPAVVGEFADQAALPVLDRGGIERRSFHRKAELSSMAHHTKPARGLEKRFARHAPAEDAQATNFPPAIDN
jgi:hypothetical protein